MSGIILLVAFLTVIFIISFIVYFLIYNKKINDRLKNQESMAHNPMASVDTIGKFLTVFCAVMVMFTLLGELNGLKSNIEAQRSSLGRQLSDLEVKISELQDQLNQQNSLISGFQYTVGEMNVEDKTVELRFACTPKTYSKDTNLTLVNGDKKIEFTYDGDGQFQAAETFSIFESFEEKSVIWQEDNGVFKTSEEWEILSGNLVDDCLPDLGRGDLLEITKKNGKVKISGNILFEERERFKDVRLYVLRNGEKIKDILDANDADTSPSFEEEVDAGQEDSVLVVLSGTDEYGFVHKQILLGYNVEVDYRMDGSASIYDSQGNLLFGAEVE